MAQARRRQRRPKQQRHSASMIIDREMSIPQYEEGGIVFTLKHNNKQLAKLRLTGAHLYLTNGRMKKQWSFSSLVKILKEAKSD